MDVLDVELWRIREPERPLREGIDSAYIESLAASIRTHGLVNPITVRDRGDFYEVVAGHCRLLALRRLGVQCAACVVRAGSEVDSEIVGAHENLVRRDMSVREEARLVVALMAREGWGIAATARAVNRGEGWVRDRLDVLQWPSDLVDAVCEGRVPLGSGKALMGVEDERERAALIEHAIRSGCSVEIARRWREDANLGAGVSGQTVNLVGVKAAVGLSGGGHPCFFCEGISSYGEMTYVWAHRECIVGMDDALRGEREAKRLEDSEVLRLSGLVPASGGGGGTGPDSEGPGPI